VGEGEEEMTGEGDSAETETVGTEEDSAEVEFGVEEEEVLNGKFVESIGEITGWTKRVSVGEEGKEEDGQDGDEKEKHPSELGCKRLMAKGNICSWKMTFLEMKTDLV
jgi:hypothetical protein